MALRMAKDLIIPAKDPRLEIVHRADPVDTWYGMDVYMLTEVKDDRTI